MRTKQLHHSAGLLLLVVSLLVLVWGFWPGRKSVYTIQMGASGPINSPVTIMLEWPSAMRQGDSGKVRLKLELHGNGSQVVLDDNSHPVIAADTDTARQGYNVVAEARLEQSRLPVTPTGEIIQPIEAGQPGEFLWSIQAIEPGDYPGTLWVHLALVPEANFGEGEVNYGVRQPLTARPVDIRVVNLLGIQGWMARVIGIVGTVLGLLLVSDRIFGWFNKHA